MRFWSTVTGTLFAVEIVDDMDILDSILSVIVSTVDWKVTFFATEGVSSLQSDFALKFELLVPPKLGRKDRISWVKWSERKTILI